MSLASYYEIRDQHKALTANNPQPVLMTSASSLLDPCLFFFLPNHPTGRGGALTSLKLSEKGWGRVKSLIAFQWKLSFQNTEPLQTFCQDHSSIKLKHRSASMEVSCLFWIYCKVFNIADGADRRSCGSQLSALPEVPTAKQTLRCPFLSLKKKENSNF